MRITIFPIVGLLGTLLCCMLPVPRAFAGPPLVTDDPETPGRGGWEINVSHNIEKTGDAFLMLSPLVDVNYGLLENDQWKIEFPILFLDPHGEPGRWGAGDLELGWKYRFREEHTHGLMASIYPQVLAPTGSRRLDLGGGRTEMLLPVEIGKHFCDERIFVYAELGYNVVFDGSGENNWIYGLAAGWQQSEKLELMFEVGGVAFPRGADPDHAFFNGGFKYELTDRWALIASAGRSFRDRQSGSPVLLTFLGLQWTTGGG